MALTVGGSGLGDFNQVLFADEHSSADRFSSPLGMREFGQCVTSVELTDLACIGNSFTWSNKQGITLVSKKLDRIMVNDEWLTMFPNALGVFGDPGISDHSPCCVFLDTTSSKPKKPFKFFSMLNQNPDFPILIRECWRALPFEGSKMLMVSRKLKAIKSVIRSFSRDNYSLLEKRVVEAFDELLACQLRTLNNPTPEAALSEKEAHHKWSILARAEDSLLQQRSKVNWLGFGDCDSAYYHRSLRTRQSINLISCLLDDGGNLLESKEDIEKHIVGYYETLLGGNQTCSTAVVSELSNLLPTTLNSSILDIINEPVTDTAIQEVFFAMPKNKSHGPDGYPAEFFTGNWKSVGRDVMDAVHEFFSSGYLLQQWNTTILSLIRRRLMRTV
ncbi:uncharacterized protein LOC125590643 [Brassica napus]|uniref:uncharacterized protein LOC125590643 n=1 Tax=Brassica napus TaxID=3708 RepID=UPI00207AC7EA|nr:uncharacterized protein LOC125590643 [Brassica napus]